MFKSNITCYFLKRSNIATSYFTMTGNALLVTILGNIITTEVTPTVTYFGGCKVQQATF